MIKLDNVNFDSTFIEMYFETVVNYVFDLFEDTIVEEETSAPKNTVVISEPIVNKSIKIAAVTEEREITEQELDLFGFVRNRRVAEKEDTNTNYEKIETMKKALRTKIADSMVNYRKECRNIDITKYLEENGNDYYNLMLKKNKIDHLRIKWEDALYCSKFFDSVKWWQQHENIYPELAAAASILLGKPTHNAFQERVFSRGTYTDTKLRKRLKEEHFEMSVLNAVNGKQIDEVFELMTPRLNTKENERQKFKKEFLQNRLNEPEAKELESEKPPAIPEYATVCSENTIDMMSDDEDDGNDELIMKDFKLIDNIESISDGQNSKNKLV